MFQIILASESPRRKQLLEKAGLQFRVYPSKVSEILDKNLTVQEQILDVARQKSLAVREEITDFQRGNYAILAADTMVVVDGEPLGKPQNEQMAFEYLTRLSNRQHEVMTGLVFLFSNGTELSHLETTQVHFKKLTDEEIWSYIQTKEPMDKAGAYGIQGLGGKFVDHIAGDFDNVVGLPVFRVLELLTKAKAGLK